MSTNRHPKATPNSKGGQFAVGDSPDQVASDAPLTLETAAPPTKNKSKCTELVPTPGTWNIHRCTKTATADLDANGYLTKCFTHSKEGAAKRRAKRLATERARSEREAQSAIRRSMPEGANLCECCEGRGWVASQEVES